MHTKFRSNTKVSSTIHYERLDHGPTQSSGTSTRQFVSCSSCLTEGIHTTDDVVFPALQRAFWMHLRMSHGNFVNGCFFSPRKNSPQMCLCNFSVWLCSCCAKQDQCHTMSAELNILLVLQSASCLLPGENVGQGYWRLSLTQERRRGSPVGTKVRFQTRMKGRVRMRSGFKLSNNMIVCMSAWSDFVNMQASLLSFRLR